MKKTVKKLGLTLATASLACLMPMMATAATSTGVNRFPPNVPAGTTASYFFVQTASLATLHSGLLTLEGLYPKNIWFTDAPERMAGSLGMNEYLDTLWKAKNAPFKADNPNAAVSGYVVDAKGQRNRVNFILTLEAVHYSAKSNLLSYKTSHLLYADTLKPVIGAVSIQQPTLFIDAYVPPTTYPHG